MIIDWGEIRSHNILDRRKRFCDDGALEVRIEEIPHVTSRIVGNQSIQGSWDLIIGRVHEYRDHNNDGCDSIIYQC